MLVHARTPLCAYMHAHTYSQPHSNTHTHASMLARTPLCSYTGAQISSHMHGHQVLTAFVHSYTAGTVLQCPAGEHILMHMSTTPTTFDAWKIDCGSVQSMNNGTQVEFENPTCKQLQLGNSPLNTYQCAGLPLQPAMLSTSGTISCSVCNPPSPPRPDSRIYEYILGECVVNLNTTAGANKTVCASICTAPSPPPTPAPIRYRCAGGPAVYHELHRWGKQGHLRICLCGTDTAAHTTANLQMHERAMCGHLGRRGDKKAM
jgi:hypothetical protein